MGIFVAYTASGPGCVDTYYTAYLSRPLRHIARGFNNVYGYGSIATVHFFRGAYYNSFPIYHPPCLMVCVVTSIVVAFLLRAGRPLARLSRDMRPVRRRSFSLPKLPQGKPICHCLRRSGHSAFLGPIAPYHGVPPSLCGGHKAVRQRPA